MNPALLLIDVQNDFLQRPGIHPSPEILVQTLATLVSRLRQAGITVIHAHTRVRADGSDRMPHWIHNDYMACVDGTSGCLSPDVLMPVQQDYLVTKQFYSAFESPRLDAILKDEQVDTLVVAGLFTHGCVRSSVLDAYARGYRVLVAEDAVASNEPGHAGNSVKWLRKRAATFLSSDEIVASIQGQTTTKHVPAAGLAANACINGVWLHDNTQRHLIHRNPSDYNEILSSIRVADAVTVRESVQTVRGALDAGSMPPSGDRCEIMYAWADRLAQDKPRLVRLLAKEIGKPLTDAEEEVERAVSGIRSVARMASARLKPACSRSDRFCNRIRSVGSIALVTPWNNPIAIPAGKIAPALLFGNGVVFKPAVEAVQTTAAFIYALFDAGLPKDLISVVFGDSETAQQIMRHPDINAVSITGSVETGGQVSSLCSRLNKPLQAELGGNNAAIIMDDADLGTVVPLLVKSAYGFAGQRCTATRRIIAVRTDYEEFIERLIGTIGDLVTGDPADAETEIGPLISREHRLAVSKAVEQALECTAGRLLCGGEEPSGWHQGSWYLPTLIDNAGPDSQIVQNETFGPVVVIQKAGDLDEAIALCNGVPQGLVATLYSDDLQVQSSFASRAEAGILRINPRSFGIHPDAPFSGWKASGIGPPEHGVWDAEFYSRAQVLYGETDVLD